jgi:hypothetical protein
MLWLTMLVMTMLGKELSQSISPVRLIVWFPPSKEIRLYSPARFPGSWKQSLFIVSIANLNPQT